ncbi:hypothetical protein ANO11243_094620 [Dothideomycetidae sp. 11243]|nr:hypothetical protein ANO11243_094620 [fungal sp. No.11243]
MKSSSTLPIAFGLLSAGVSTAAASCVAANVAIVTKGAPLHTAFFCEFYNARKRQLSPFPALTAAEAIAACTCILATAPASATASIAPLPQPTTGGVSGSCYAYDMNLVNKNFPDSKDFCTFFNGFSGANLPQQPIPGLTPARVSAACVCILNGVTFPTATPAAAFCASAPVKSLIAGQPSAAPFCQSILGMKTVTQTATKSDESLVTKVVTHTVFTPKVLTTTVDPVDMVTVPGTFCGNGATRFKKRGPATEPTPSYLSGKAAAYVTSACKCVPSLTSPTTTTTITSQTAKVVTNDVTVTLASGTSYNIVPGQNTLTETTDVPTATGVMPKATSYTYLNKRSETMYWGYWNDVTLVKQVAYAVFTVTCNGVAQNSVKCTAPGNPGCMQTCDEYNMYLSSTCVGVSYDATTNACTLYRNTATSAEPLLTQSTDCGVFNGTAGSYVAGTIS